MPERRDYTDPWAAMRVSDFMEEASVGRWHLLPFDVDEEHRERSRLRAAADADSQEELDLMLARAVPVGHYISLRRRRTRAESRAELDDIVNENLDDDAIDRLRLDPGTYVPVMSDTPAEIDEHEHAIAHGTGRVLIHGLGLGCLVSGLLAKPDVTHIDVVEVDPEVIALTGGYYTSDPRVAIHEGDAMTYEWSPDAHWDYVWHDIWTHISSRNLDPEQAEHGISYGMLLDRFADRAALQGAWAMDLAQQQGEALAAQRAEQEAWADRFFAATDEDKVELLVDHLIREQIGTGMLARIPEDEPITPELRAFADEHLGVTEVARKIVAKGLDREKIMAGWRSQADQPEPLAHPNAELPEYHYNNEGHRIHDA